MKITTVDDVIESFRDGQNIFRRPSVELLVREIERLKTRQRWIPYKPSWAAPACNSRQIVKLSNGWVCCATYFYNKDHAEKDPCWQWKNDCGEWIDPDAVIYWKGLEE